MTPHESPPSEADVADATVLPLARGIPPTQAPPISAPEYPDINAPRVQVVRANWKARSVAGLVLAATTVVLGIGMWLRPDPAGYGTHMQLGLMPCGTMAITGKPCPTCGMTTAFANLLHLHPLAALHAQPAGALFCLATIAAWCASFWCLMTGQAWRVNWERIRADRVAMALAAIFLLGWGYRLLIHLLTKQA